MHGILFLDVGDIPAVRQGPEAIHAILHISRNLKDNTILGEGQGLQLDVSKIEQRRCRNIADSRFEGRTRFSNLYRDAVENRLLATHLDICKLNGTIEDEIVCNDIEFTNDKTVQILTGPNRGGKTILTQGIGLAFLLYQSGVFVPARSASVKLCSGIYTHFPVEEERTVSLGRLGEEAARFCEISKSADSESLVLLNESFATTSHTESLYIAEDAIKYLCCVGARTIFNTHMHELAAEADTFGKTEGAVCKAVSMVMENNNGERSYKVSYKSPDGKSYAHEIAYNFGTTFEQLMGEYNSRGGNSRVDTDNDIQNDVQTQ